MFINTQDGSANTRRNWPGRQALALLLAFILCPQLTWAVWLSDSREMMGTQITVELWHPNEAIAQQAKDEVFAEFQRLDLMMNPWNPASELSRINREGATKSLTTTKEICEVVNRALHYSQLSNGAFDISFASAGQHYDYKQGTRPDANTLELDRNNIDYTAIELEIKKQRIALHKNGMQLDLGGIAKGYAVDRGIDILLSHGIESAVITAGGDSRILGDLGERARTIGIRHPRKAGEYAVLIPLADTAISTSGDYERFFVEDGVRFHHILDPSTGESAQGVQSASVMSDKAIDSDALSTTVFVLGVEQGLALVNSLPGVDAIIIDGEGRLHYSDDLLLSSSP
ncbi:MAG: FAD:protein FMN transferase [Pseudomonadota bacterium]